MSSTTQSAPWVGTAARTTVDHGGLVVGRVGSLHSCAGAGWACGRRPARLDGRHVDVDRPRQGARAPYRGPTRLSAGQARFILTYLALLAVLSAGVAALRADVRRFRRHLHGRCSGSPMRAGSSAPTPISPRSRRPTCSGSASPGRFRLTNEGGYIFALIAGLIIANALSAFCRMAQGRGPVRNSTSRSRSCCSAPISRVTIAGKLNLATLGAVARRRRHHRGLSDLLGGGLLRRPQVVRL